MGDVSSPSVLSRARPRPPWLHLCACVCPVLCKRVRCARWRLTRWHTQRTWLQVATPWRLSPTMRASTAIDDGGQGWSGALAGDAGRVVLMNTIFGSGLEIQQAKHYPMLTRVRANMGCAPCRFRCKRGESVCFWGWEGGHTQDATAWGIFSRNPKKVEARAWSCARWRATSPGTCGGGFPSPTRRYLTAAAA